MYADSKPLAFKNLTNVSFIEEGILCSLQLHRLWSQTTKTRQDSENPKSTQNFQLNLVKHQAYN